MAEKFRRIKKERPRLVKNIFTGKFLIAGLVLIFLSGLAAWSYWGSDVLREDSPGQTQIVDRALAAVVCRNGECFWLNKEGVSFNKSGRTAGNLVLSFEDKTDRDLKVGERLLDPNVLSELAFIKQRAYSELGLNLKIGEVDDAKLLDFNFITQEGWALKISTGQNAYKTIEILKQTLAEIKKAAPTAGLEYIDLRVPNKVYYRFK